MSEHDLDFLQSLLDLPERTAQSPRAKKHKDIRDVESWFHNPNIVHNISTGVCSSGDDCLGKLLYNKGPERVTALINGVEMCRICFLDGLAYRSEV